jgi:putative pyruvate formate lyase activating enzyme
MPTLPVLARAALHQWEEPPVSGTQGSGTIFFSGCALKCVFCQNEEISYENFGGPVSMARLREICGELVRQGAHNINLVNPTHYAHVVKEMGPWQLPVPLVYNSGGYERVETLRELEGTVDVYLPDLKYLDSATAGRYSAAPDYPQVAQAAIREMVRQTGPVVLENGLIKKGVIIRHLILPGQLAGAKQVMDWVSETFRPGEVLFSLMSQYTPWGRAEQYPEINRKLRKAEIRAANTYMENLGLVGFTQEGGAASEGYIPGFDLTGVYPQEKGAL